MVDYRRTALTQPAGFGFPFSLDPGVIRAQATDVLAVPTANGAVYFRTPYGGTISKVALVVSVASGNISVGAYRNSLSARLSVPGSQLATSGAIACPAAGYQEIALTAPCTLRPGDWLAISADNVTATFRALLAQAGDTNLGNGRQMRQATAHPLPATPSTLIGTSGYNILLIGVP